MSRSLFAAESGPKNSGWNALDPHSDHPIFNPTIDNEAEEENRTLQASEEVISISDSADVEVNTTNNQAAISLQVALQVAISAIISISIADSAQADSIRNDLLATTSIRQVNRQKTFIHNSRNVVVTTTDNELAVNIQILLQIVIALLVRLDIL